MLKFTDNGFEQVIWNVLNQIYLDSPNLIALLTIGLSAGLMVFCVIVVHQSNAWHKLMFQVTTLLQFRLDHSEFFTRETRHIEPLCNKARISKFCLEFLILNYLQRY